MSVDVREVGGICIIHPNETRLIVGSAEDDFRAALNRVIDAGHLALAVDMAGVEYADARTISTLIESFKLLNRNGGSLCLYNLAEGMRDFFRQTVLDNLIETRPNESAAVSFFANLPKRKRKGLRGLFG